MSESTESSVVPLNPEETEARGFDVVLRGYDRTQVDRHVAWLENLLSSAEDQHASAESELGALREEVTALRERSAEWERGRPSFESLGERIGQMLAIAEQEAEAIKATARQEVSGLQQRIDRENLEAAARRDREDKAAAKAREDQNIKARSDSERILAEARQQAAEMLDAARRQVDKLNAQRDTIHGELARLQDRLTAAMGLVSSAPADDPEQTMVVLPPEAAETAPGPQRTS